MTTSREGYLRGVGVYRQPFRLFLNGPPAGGRRPLDFRSGAPQQAGTAVVRVGSEIPPLGDTCAKDRIVDRSRPDRRKKPLTPPARQNPGSACDAAERRTS